MTEVVLSFRHSIQHLGYFRFYVMVDRNAEVCEFTMFYCLLKLLISVGLIVAINPTCKKVAMELRCVWERYKTYTIPEGTLFVYFDRFFKPAVLDLPDSVKRLRIEDTDYSCNSFHQVDDLRLNGVSCVSFYAPEGTSDGILKSNRPSVRPSVCYKSCLSDIS